MRRREFLGVPGGAATTWPLAARAQQTERVRRIGALLGISAGDPEAPPRVAAFLSGLHDLGWDDGRNIKIELRFGGSEANSIRAYAILTQSNLALAAMHESVPGALPRYFRHQLVPLLPKHRPPRCQDI
jgi:hypothetical protein